MMIRDIKVKHLKDACQAVLIYGHEEKKGEEKLPVVEIFAHFLLSK